MSGKRSEENYGSSVWEGIRDLISIHAFRSTWEESPGQNTRTHLGDYGSHVVRELVGSAKGRAGLKAIWPDESLKKCWLDAETLNDSDRTRCCDGNAGFSLHLSGS